MIDFALDTLHSFFRIPLSFYTQGIYFRFNLMNSIIMAPLFSSFIRPGTFLFLSGIPYIVNHVIARVKFTHVTFHDIVNIVIFYVIYKAICVSIHNFAFFVKHRCHVFVMKFVQTRLGYVEDAHPRIGLSNITSSLRNQILRKDTSIMEI